MISPAQLTSQSVYSAGETNTSGFVPVFAQMFATPGDVPEDRPWNALIWTTGGPRRKGWVTTAPNSEMGIQVFSGLELAAGREIRRPDSLNFDLNTQAGA